MPSASKHLLLQSFYATLARFTGVGLNFALHILMARLLTLGHYGDIRMLLTLVTGVALLSRIGVEQLVVKEIASVDSNQEIFATQFLKRCYLVVFITSLLFIVFWIVFSPMMKTSLFGEVSLYNLMIASVGVLFFNLVTLNAFYLKALRKSSITALVQNALPAASFLILIFIFWSDFPHNQRYINLYTLSNIVAGLVSILVILPWVKTRPTQDNLNTDGANKTTVPAIKEIVKRSLPLAPVSAFSFFMLWSDTLMVGALLSNEEVGLYSTAASISFLSLFILGALDATIYPRLLSLSKNKPEQFKSFFWKATRLVIFGLLAVTIVMALLAKPALALFGPAFKQATVVLLILLLAQWLRATSLTFSFLFIIKDQVRFLNMTLVIALIINLIANYFFIQSEGMQGAATATLLANGFLAGVVVLLFYRQKLLAGYS